MILYQVKVVLIELVREIYFDAAGHEAKNSWLVFENV